MATLYDRRVAITVDGFRFVSDPSLNFEPQILEDGRLARNLRISFKVERSLESKSNKAQAQIFNLNEDTRGRIATRTKLPQFIIEAGYRDTYAQVFEGQAVEITTTRNAPGVVTTVKAQDGFKASKERFVKSYTPGVKVGDVIGDIAASLGVNAKKSIARAKAGDFTGGVKQLFSGLSVSGNSQTELDKLAKTYGFDWSIQDGELQVLLPTETTTEESVVLGPDTGLVGSPERVLDEKKPGKIFVRGRSLLQPKIKPGRRLEIESNEISGSYRVLSVTHTGQSDGGDFFSDFEAAEIP